MGMTIKGRAVMRGDVQAEAIVTKEPLSFTYIDPDTGTVIDTTHMLHGQNIKDKILILPMIKGSAMQPFSLYQLVKKRVAPKGLIALEADVRLMVAAIYCEIPLIDKLEKNPLEIISTGDLVHLNGDKGMIEVWK